MIRRSLALVPGVVLWVAVVCAPVSAQVRVQDVVITSGAAVEAYDGNLASVTAPVVDSTESAAARVGQIGVRADLLLHQTPDRVVSGGFDFGLRQFAAEGFSARDFAPRELAGRIEVSAWQRFDVIGNVGVEAGWRGRRVDDRPPMPLFLQPGFQEGRVALAWESRPTPDGLRFDARVDYDNADYRAPERVRQLDLLDRNSVGVELGAAWGQTSNFRVYTVARRTRYPRQSSFDPDDPFRRDRTYSAGARWSYRNGFILELGLEGVVNRSNSSRPEYDAASLSTQFAAPLPWWDLSVNVIGILTGKRYVEETEFARLVPGEEADNASVLFVDVGRSVASNLDATLRLGWTRAETDIGEAFYERVGLGVLFNFRPFG